MLTQSTVWVPSCLDGWCEARREWMTLLITRTCASVAALQQQPPFRVIFALYAIPVLEFILSLPCSSNDGKRIRVQHLYAGDRLEQSIFWLEIWKASLIIQNRLTENSFSFILPIWRTAPFNNIPRIAAKCMFQDRIRSMFVDTNRVHFTSWPSPLGMHPFFFFFSSDAALSRFVHPLVRRCYTVHYFWVLKNSWKTDSAPLSDPVKASSQLELLMWRLRQTYAKHALILYKEK